MVERLGTGVEHPWYGAGLRFLCISCGRCCTGEPGAVWVSASEVARLAVCLELSEAELERRYLRLRGVRKAIHERFNGDCIFYDRDLPGCRVYEARPIQCRTWPFWEPLVASRAAWDGVAKACPGCGRGALVPAEAIEGRQRELAEARDPVQ